MFTTNEIFIIVGVSTILLCLFFFILNFWSKIKLKRLIKKYDEEENLSLGNDRRKPITKKELMAKLD